MLSAALLSNRIYFNAQIAKNNAKNKNIKDIDTEAQRRFARLALTRRVTKLGIILPNNAQKTRRYRGRIAAFRETSLCLCVSVFKLFLFVVVRHWVRTSWGLLSLARS